MMPSTFDGMLKQAQVLVKSGMLPSEVKTPEAAVAIMLKGRELDIPPMQAFSSIYVVKGKPTISAQLIGALIFRAGHGYHVDKLDDAGCVITFNRKGATPYQHTFSIENAKAAGLAGAETWKKYTKAMLFSRCMSAGARIAFPDIIAGMYTTEELADPESVTVDEASGEVVYDADYSVVEDKSEPPTQEPDNGNGEDVDNGHAAFIGQREAAKERAEAERPASRRPSLISPLRATRSR